MPNNLSRLKRSLSIAIFAVFSIGLLKASATLLIGNTNSNNVVIFDEKTGKYLGIFIPPKTGGLAKPDDLIFGPDGDLYISSGETSENSAVLRYDGNTGEFKGTFASGNGMVRPYGLTFGPDGNLYVSSFKSDRILRFNGETGQFIDVFAASNGSPEGLNGPNDLLFTSDGSLYVTTQGTLEGEKKPNFFSQVLKFKPGETKPTVFAKQPSQSPSGFVSLLGLALGAQNDLFVSDFGNNIRRYDLKTGELIATIATNYTKTNPSNNSIGNLTFDSNRFLYTVGFDSQNQHGVILRYDAITGKPLPESGNTSSIFVSPNQQLSRPVGIIYTPKELTPESQNIEGETQKQ
jgi:sugar lactone lactonase YvrE